MRLQLSLDDKRYRFSVKNGPLYHIMHSRNNNIFTLVVISWRNRDVYHRARSLNARFGSSHLALLNVFWPKMSERLQGMVKRKNKVSNPCKTTFYSKPFQRKPTNKKYIAKNQNQNQNRAQISTQFHPGTHLLTNVLSEPSPAPVLHRPGQGIPWHAVVAAPEPHSSSLSSHRSPALLHPSPPFTSALISLDISLSQGG